jgi:hypothetical protein
MLRKFAAIEKGNGVREGDRTIDDMLDAFAAHYEITREEVLAGHPNLWARHVSKHLACRITKQLLGQTVPFWSRQHYEYHARLSRD